MASLSSFWEHYEGDEEWSCDVHARASGDRVATFKPPGVDAHSKASLAFVTEDRVAMATSSSFKVVKLPMGQLYTSSCAGGGGPEGCWSRHCQCTCHQAGFPARGLQ